MRCSCVLLVLLFACILCVSYGCSAAALKGDVCVAVLDGETMQPIEGATVVFLPADKNWPLSDEEAAKVKTNRSDVEGFVTEHRTVGGDNPFKAKGWGRGRGKSPFADPEFVIRPVVIHVEKEGYRPLTASVGFFAAQIGRKCAFFLPDILLAKANSQGESAVSEGAVNAQAVNTDPKYVTVGNSLKVEITTTYPRSLAIGIGNGLKSALEVAARCPGAWEKEAFLEYVGPKNGDAKNGCVWSGQVAVPSNVKSGAYPIDIHIYLSRREQCLMPGVAHVAIGSTEAEAKELYDKNIAPLEVK